MIVDYCRSSIDAARAKTAPRGSARNVDALSSRVTGQNPFSSEALAKQFLDLLEGSHDNLYDRRAS